MTLRFLALQAKYFPHWNAFCRTFYSLNRQVELERLIQWAQDKRLAGPLNLYRQRLEDEQVRYARYVLISPRAALIANLIHFLTSPFRPIPRYYRKGSAASYRAKYLDRIKNRHIVFGNN